MAIDLGPITIDIEQAVNKLEDLHERIENVFQSHQASDDPRIMRVLQQVRNCYFELQKLDKKIADVDFNPYLIDQLSEVQSRIRSINSELTRSKGQMEEWSQVFAPNANRRDFHKQQAIDNPDMFLSMLKNGGYTKKQYEAGLNYVETIAKQKEMRESLAQLAVEEQELTAQLAKQAPVQDQIAQGYGKISDKMAIYEARLNSISPVTPPSTQESVVVPKTTEETIKRTDENTRSAVNSTKMWKSALAGVSGALGGIKKVFSSIRSGANKVTSAFRSMHKSSSGTLNDMSRGFKRGLRTLVKYLFGVRSIFFLYRRLRQAATEYLGEMSKQIPAVNKQMSSIKQSMNQMKGSLATAIQPLLNVLVPILKTISEWVTNIADKVASFFALLTGQKVIYHATAGAVDYAESLDKTGKSADKAKKKLESYLSPIDEINKLQAQKEDEDAGSDSGSGGSVSYETIPVDESVIKFLERLKEMWEEGNFYELGKEMGEKLQEVLESIPWDKIQETANKLGKSFATLLNGFLEVEGLGYDIGNTVAQAINTVFELVNGFVHNFNWDALGSFIANTFNGLFEGIDWDLIQDTVFTGIQGLVDSINAFIRDFHWDNISTTVGEIVTTIVGAIEKVFNPETGVKFGDLGYNFGEQLKDIIKNLPENEIGETLGHVLHGIVSLAIGFLKGANGGFTTLVQKVKGMLNSMWNTLSEEDKQFLGNTLKNVLIYVVTFAVGKAVISTAITTLGTKIMGAIFGSSGAAAAGTTAGTSFGSGFASGLINAILAVLAGVGIGSLIKDTIFLEMQGLFNLSGDYDERNKMSALFDRYKGLSGTFKMFKEFFGDEDVAIPLYNDMNELYAVVNQYGEEVVRINGVYADSTIPTMEEVRDKAREQSKSYEEAIQLLAKYNWSTAGSYEDVMQRAEKLRTEMGLTTDDMVSDGTTMQQGYFSPIEEASDNMYGTVSTNTQKTATDVTNMSTKTREEMARMGTGVKVSTETAGKSVDAFGRTVETESYDMPKNFSSAGAKMSYTCGTLERDFDDTDKSVSKSADDMERNVGRSADGMKKTFDKGNWTLSGVKDGLAETFENAIRRIKDIWNGFADWLNSKLEINIDTSSFLGEKIASLIGGSRLSLGHIPRLAQGAVIPPNKEFMAVLGDQRNGTNIETPLSTMVDAFNQALAQNDSGQKVTLNLILPDKRTIAQYAIEGGQVLQMSRGRNPFLLEKG